MTIGTTNIGFSTIQTEYGGSNPISLSEYYRGGSFVLAHPNNTGLAASGAISVSAFFNQSKRWIVAITISAATSNFNLRSYLNTTYGDYSSIPTDVTVTINSGVTVYSTSVSTPAFDTGDGWESSSTITIVNNGQISGMGGAGGLGGNGNGEAGGNAINLRYSVTINNTSGNIYGGGGGGGGGASIYWTSNGAYTGSGGGGGGGQSYQASSGGGNQGYNLQAVGYTINQAPANGSNGGNSGAGAGGVGTIAYQDITENSAADTSTAGTGGTGGGWGTAGNNGGTSSPGSGIAAAGGGGTGGAAGKAIELNGFTATFSGGNNATQVKGAQSTQTSSDTTFTQYSGSRRIYLVTLNTGKTHFNLYTHVGSPSGVVCDVTVTINTGIVVYATSTGSPAFSTGSGWGATTTIAIVNNGYIIGMGGAGGNGSTVAGGAGNAGGNALSLTNNVTVTNASGFIYGGGGGGGGGGGASNGSGNPTSISGGGGGGGQSYQTSAGGSGSNSGGNGTNSGAGAGGAGITMTTGGEAPTTLATSGAGGNGGGYGADGSAGASATNVSGSTVYGGGGAGAAGKAVALNGYSITFVSGNDSTHVKGAQS